ncbi:MAG: hypothetical protein EZS28_038986, partial [Streblomastix strix]
GHMRRIWTTAVIDNDDKQAYLGSTTGDIVAFDIQNYYLKHFEPVKDKTNFKQISQLKKLKRTIVLGKITILKIQPLGYGLATKTMKRSMSPKQIGSKKTAVPTRGPSRKVNIKGRVVPIATAERFLIPRQKKTIRQNVYSWELKSLLFYLTVAIDQQLECSIYEPTMDAELVRSSHRNDIIIRHLRSGNELVRIEVSSVLTFQNSSAIVKGGSEGQVRLWKLGHYNQQLTMKELRIAETAVRVTQDDLERVSGVFDGKMIAQTHIFACNSDCFATYFYTFDT